MKVFPLRYFSDFRQLYQQFHGKKKPANFFYNYSDDIGGDRRVYCPSK